MHTKRKTHASITDLTPTARSIWSWSRGSLPLLLVVLGGGLAPQKAQGAPTANKSARTTKSKSASAASAQNSAVNARDSLLGPDDVLEFIVLRHEELSVKEITIPASGRIDLPRVGTIMASGKTLDQLTREIEKRLSKVLVRPTVNVSLKQGRSRLVYVLGAVKNPSVYPIKFGWRISEALAAAGDLQDIPDDVAVTLTHARGGSVTFDVAKILKNPSGPENRRLIAGDSLTFNPQERRVTVSGDVTKPDQYPLSRAPRLLDALNAAGWLKQEARSTHAILQREGKRIELNIARAVMAEDSQDNIVLQANDVLLVDAIQPLKVSVDGFVRTPGNYELEPGSGVVQALAQAGGLTAKSELVVLSVRRGTQLIPVNLDRVATDPSADVLLQSGDFVMAAEPQVTRIQITGWVRVTEPQRIPRQQATLAEALSRAGGITATPTQVQISVLRQVNGKPVALHVDPVQLLEGRDLRQNVQLQDGDLISVTPVRLTAVYLSGEVARPGPYELKQGEGLAELITRAGGPTPSAALTKVNLGRNGSTQIVDVYDTFNGLAPAGAPKPGGSLQEGDFIVVPRNENQVMVIQSVQRPGPYPIPERKTLTVADAISAAGGPRDRATVKEVAVLRATPQGTEKRILRMDRIYKGDLTQNIVLRPGDYVVVPQTKVSGSVLSQIGSIIGLGLGLGAVSNQLK